MPVEGLDSRGDRKYFTILLTGLEPDTKYMLDIMDDTHKVLK